MKSDQPFWGEEFHISKILGRTLEDYQKDPEVIKTSAEMQRQIVLLLLHYPEKSNPEFVELSEVSKKTTWNAVVNDDTAWKLSDKIIALAAMLGLWMGTDERSAPISLCREPSP